MVIITVNHKHPNILNSMCLQDGSHQEAGHLASSLEPVDNGQQAPISEVTV